MSTKKCLAELCLTDRTWVWSRKVDTIWMMKSWFCQTLLLIWTVAALEYNIYAIIMFGKMNNLKKYYCHAKILNVIFVKIWMQCKKSFDSIVNEGWGSTTWPSIMVCGKVCSYAWLDKTLFALKGQNLIFSVMPCDEYLINLICLISTIFYGLEAMENTWSITYGMDGTYKSGVLPWEYLRCINTFF